MGNRFNTEAGITRQFGAEGGKDLSLHAVSRRLRAFRLTAYSAVTKPLKHYFCCQTGERLNPNCVKSVKGGGGSVMVWGMFSELGLLNNYMANVYQNRL